MRHALSRLIAGVALFVGAALFASACGIPDGDVEIVPVEEVPSRLAPEASGATASTLPVSDLESPTFVSLYWVKGKKLSPQVAVAPDTIGAEGIVRLLEQDPIAGDGLRSAISEGDVIGDVFVEGSVVVLDLTSDFDDVGEGDQTLALGQIVLSLTEVPEIDEVDIRVEGELVDVPTANGRLVRRPLLARDYASLVVDG